MFFLVKSIERFHCIGAADVVGNGVLSIWDTGAGLDTDTVEDVGFDGSGLVGTGICFGCCTIDTGAPGSFTHGSKGDFGACTKGTLGACAKGIFGNCVSFIIVYKYKIIKLLVNINWF